MKRHFITSAILILAIIATLAGCTTTQQDDTRVTEMEGVATQLTVSIDRGLEDLKTTLKNNSDTLSTVGITEEEANALLTENLLKYPWSLSSLVISKEGVVMGAVPENYAKVIGMNLSLKPQVMRANREKVPIVSDLFLMVEGFNAISQSYPIYSSSGDYLGYTDITYTSDAFLGRHIRPVTDETPYDVWVAQTDGTILYDTKTDEIGNNLFSNPAYNDPALQAMLTRIAEEPSGSGEYTFWNKQWNGNVTKKAVWKTAGTDGAVWRVVVTYTDDKNKEENRVIETNTANNTDARYENLTAFVNSAADYAKKYGKEAALKEFNDINGTFIDGEIYVFAYDMNGTVVSLPYQQGLLETVRTGIPDPNGVEFIDGLIEVAGEGGGSLYYIYPNPEDGYEEEFKLAYVMPVDSEWFVGAGIYLPELPAGFNDTEIDELVTRVKNARNYAQKNGKTEVLSDFNDQNSSFADGSRYIFAYDYNGTTLALPYQPELIGQNRLNFSDTCGVKILNQEISTAKRGGGFVYVQYINPDTGDAGLKLCYVAPVNDEWFVGSGIYTKKI